MLNHIALQRKEGREGRKEEKMAGGANRGRLLEGGARLFQIFPSKGGDYLREAINRGTAIIRGYLATSFYILELSLLNVNLIRNTKY